MNAVREGLQSHDATALARFLHPQGALVRARPDRRPERHLYARCLDRGDSVF